MSLTANVNAVKVCVVSPSVVENVNEFAEVITQRSSAL